MNEVGQASDHGNSGQTFVYCHPRKILLLRQCDPQVHRSLQTLHVLPSAFVDMKMKKPC